MPKLPQPLNNYGLILYTIERDDCLNGVFTNPGVRGEIHNEIAKKTVGGPGIAGQYVCLYIDINNERESCNLEITPDPTVTNLFRFDWSDTRNGTFYFEGRGYQMDDSHIVVYYW